MSYIVSGPSGLLYKLCIRDVGRCQQIRTGFIGNLENSDKAWKRGSFHDLTPFSVYWEAS